MKNGTQYWRSLEQLADSPEFKARLNEEFPLGAAELEVKSGVDRRNFLGLLGASMALAGVTSTGCIRKPSEKILPYAVRPEDLVEGRAQQYASVLRAGPTVLGVLVTTHENRPTKVEGNPMHPHSLGGTNVWAQSSVLDLYDPDRSRMPLQGGNPASWQTAEAQLAEIAASIRTNAGTGTAILMESAPSSVLRGLVSELQRASPSAKVYVDDAGDQRNQRAALAAVGLPSSQVVLELDKADVVLSLDADFLGVEGDVVRNSKLFMSRRRVGGAESTMNRLYVVEPNFTNTGFVADNRLLLRGGEIGEFLLALVGELASKGVAVAPTGARSVSSSGKSWQRWVSSVASDLAANRGRAVVVVGDKQPAWVHGLAVAVNEALAATGSTVRYLPDPDDIPTAGGLLELTQALRAGGVQTLVMLGGNPVYDAPADLEFGNALRSARVSVHLSYHADETSRLSSIHVPRCHALEAWGDLRSADGTYAIMQPTIAPLFESQSDVEFLARIVGRQPARGYEITKNHWQQKLNRPDFERLWARWLHDGVVSDVERPNVTTISFEFGGLGRLLSESQPLPEPSAQSLEVRFPISSQVYDGSYANNAWLQEQPDAVSKLTWDNAALLSPSSAKELGVENGDMLNLELEGRTLAIPAWITPGVAPHVVVVPRGWGRGFEGRVCKGTGFNANAIRTSRSPFHAAGAKVSKGKGTYVLADTQNHGSMEGRPLVRETTLADFKQQPEFVRKYEVIDLAKQKTLLWRRPYEFTEGHQWGMSIDLNVCTGCNACSVACTAENNVSVVGKDRVLKGREMHWMRIDRYFNGSVDDPQVVSQPMLCLHCENAPCEQVCPVGATVHSPDGMNDMAYNRCIGTRYCANNCPYKVRRFNYFAFAKENDEQNPLYAMQKNPNVTVRFRGVIEKCSYCVQRVNDAKIEAKRISNGVVPDGRIVTACAQACPTDAIVFGDVNDPNSRVSQSKAGPRNYALLGELATQPRTTYLAKLRNPNPELV
jgi:molybdopterin-containing oxidoreductase family iron-sulfur binding subunit